MTLVQKGSNPSDRFPGRTQNCNNFGTWVGADQAASNKYKKCHGGIITRDDERHYYRPCGIREECKAYTLDARPTVLDPYMARRHLPIAPDDPRRAQIIASTPNSPNYRIMGRTITPDDLPNTMRQLSVPIKGVVPQTISQTTTTPAGAAYAAFPGAPSGVSPTFLPKKNESIFSRLFANIGNGIVASFGWHLFSYAQVVDIFGRP